MDGWMDGILGEVDVGRIYVTIFSNGNTTKVEILMATGENYPV
jgi:hypothetical protein